MGCQKYLQFLGFLGLVAGCSLHLMPGQVKVDDNIIRYRIYVTDFKTHISFRRYGLPIIVNYGIGLKLVCLTMETQLVLPE